MKVAVTAEEASLSGRMGRQFGRAKYFVVVDTETKAYEAHSNLQNISAMQGAGIQAAQCVANLGVEAVITGNVGPKAFKALQAAGIKVFLGDAGTVADAVDLLGKDKLHLAQNANVESHWM